MNVFMIAAQTIDGQLAERVGQTSTDWTSAEDKQWFRQRTKEAGVVVMGSTTYDTVGRPMPNRFNIVMTHHPEKYSGANDQLLFTSQSPKDIISMLESKKYSEVAILGGSSVYTQFMQQGLINKIYLTIEPLIFGKGVPIFNDTLSQKLKLVDTKHLNDNTLLLEYDVV